MKFCPLQKRGEDLTQDLLVLWGKGGDPAAPVQGESHAQAAMSPVQAARAGKGAWEAFGIGFMVKKKLELGPDGDPCNDFAKLLDGSGCCALPAPHQVPAPSLGPSWAAWGPLAAPRTQSAKKPP